MTIWNINCLDRGECERILKALNTDDVKDIRLRNRIKQQFATQTSLQMTGEGC